MGPSLCATSGSEMPRAAICRVERPYADLGMTILLADSAPDVDGASGWKPMPIEAVHGAAVLLLARNELLLTPKQAVWPANLALRACVLQVLHARCWPTPLPDAVVSMIGQGICLYRRCGRVQACAVRRERLQSCALVLLSESADGMSYQ